MKDLEKHVSSITLIIILLCFFSAETVLADKTVDTGKSGSVTIRYFDDVDARTPVAGAEFTFYKIDDSSDLTTYTDTTNQDGILKISEMKLGRYRVVETSPSPGHKASASFLLTIPMTDHNEWVYDLTLEPKASPDLPTTSKSVYSAAGSQGTSSLYSGGSYPAGSAVTGNSTSLIRRSGTSQSEISDTAAKKAEAAMTGDETCAALWAAVNAGACLMIAVLCHRRTRRGSHTDAQCITGIDNFSQ